MPTPKPRREKIVNFLDKFGDKDLIDEVSEINNFNYKVPEEIIGIQ